MTHKTGPGMLSRHLPAAATLPLNSLHPQVRCGSQEMCGSWTERGCLVRWESQAECWFPTKCGSCVRCGSWEKCGSQERWGGQREVGVLGKVWVPGEVWLHCSRDPKPCCAQRRCWDLSVPMRNWCWAPAPFWDSAQSDLLVLGWQKRPTFLYQRSNPSCQKHLSW